MFKTAQIKLTILYSALFLLLFWLFSAGLFVWMDESLGESYISQIRERQEEQVNTGFDDTDESITEIAADVALEKLARLLLVLNGALLVVIPGIAWILAKRTLLPIKKVHEQQKQFVSDASHELRTPLTIMSGEMEVVLNKNRCTEDYRKTLVSSKEEVDRLTHPPR